MKLKIPLNNHPDISDSPDFEEFSQLAIESGRYTKGQAVAILEETVADMYNAEHAIACGSGTLALYCGLRGVAKNLLKTGYGNLSQFSFVPNFTYESVLWAFDKAGFGVTLRDVNELTYHVLDHWKPNAHLMTMDTFGSISKPIGFEKEAVIVDAAHSFGAGCRYGVRGIIQVYSFNAGKDFTTGEGGMVLTNNDIVAEETKRTRDLLSRMPELSAAVGLAFLDKMDDILERKEYNSYYYENALSEEFKPQRIPFESSNYIYAVTCEYADEIIERLKDRLEIRRYYFPPLGYLFKEDRASTAYSIGSKLMCIPSGWDTEVDVIGDILNETLEEVKG